METKKFIYCNTFSFVNYHKVFIMNPDGTYEEQTYPAESELSEVLSDVSRAVDVYTIKLTGPEDYALQVAMETYNSYYKKFNSTNLYIEVNGNEVFN